MIDAHQAILIWKVKISELSLSVLFTEWDLSDSNINYKIKFGCLNSCKSWSFYVLFYLSAFIKVLTRGFLFIHYESDSHLKTKPFISPLPFLFFSPFLYLLIPIDFFLCFFFYLCGWHQFWNVVPAFLIFFQIHGTDDCM